MFKAAFRVLVLCAAASLGSPALADWRVDRVSSPAQFSADGQSWEPVEPGAVVPDGATIQTGPRGRVLLRRGAETILFAPNSLAAVATRGTDPTRTEIVQRVGVLEIAVEKRESPHTRVRTPFLAAVVKGTTFTVAVGERTAAVSVRDGVVEVTDLRSGERADLSARQSVSVAADISTPLTVRGPGPKAPVERVTPSAPAVSPIGEAGPAFGSTTRSGVDAGVPGAGRSSRQADDDDGGEDRSHAFARGRKVGRDGDKGRTVGDDRDPGGRGGGRSRDDAEDDDGRPGSGRDGRGGRDWKDDDEGGRPGQGDDDDEDGGGEGGGPGKGDDDDD